MSKDFLVGKTILGLKIAQDKKALLFICDDGEHIARTDGDCCSSSWIENIELPAGGFSCKVNQVEYLDLDRVEGDYGDVTQHYGCNIVTDKGLIEIDFRNESNGYYGASLSWPGDDFYGGVHGQNVSELNWVEV